MAASKITPLTLATTLALAGCTQSDSELRGPRAGDTQVVAQWLVPSDGARPGFVGGLKSVAPMQRYFQAERAIEGASRGVYFEDGNDAGGGTFNVYLFTDRVGATAAQLIALEREGKIPAGLRIGVAQYTDPQRKDWTYKAYYPAGLARFDVVYSPIPRAGPKRDP